MGAARIRYFEARAQADAPIPLSAAERLCGSVPREGSVVIGPSARGVSNAAERFLRLHR